MFGKVLVKKYPNRYLRKVVETIVTPLNPQSFFKNFLLKQKRRYSSGLDKGIYTLSFDCDYQKDIQALPELLNILRRYSIHASIASVGKWIEKYPDIHRRVVDEGHEIINHTYSHPNNEELNPSRKMNELSYEEQKAEITKCHELCRTVLGYEPSGFRTPHFGNLHSKLIYSILDELGYHYSSSTAAICTTGFGAPFAIGRIIEIPVGSSIDYPFVVFDSWNMLRGPKARLRNSAEFLDCFYRTMEEIVAFKAYITHYFDPYEVIKDGKLDDMCRYLSGKRNISVIPYRELLNITSGSENLGE
jgi:peptidoglycan/xylan/chitin deacetylase (PgdA/CDA1 family)